MGCCWGSPVDEDISNSGVSLHSRTHSLSRDEVSISGHILPIPHLRVFSFAELKTVTRNFKNDTLLGKGRFGKVFKGFLYEKTQGNRRSENVFAVKELNFETLQGFEELQSMIIILRRLSLSHPNLVRLLGYCSVDNKVFLVNEYMKKGNLENHLFGWGPPLPWELRVKIAVEAARGLAFLHSSMNQVIYKEFKPSNILIDESYNAKISDFGLENTCPSDKLHGLRYAAPEYVFGRHGRPSVKSDVYGFGVVLVEILTGLRVFDRNRRREKRNLVIWAKPYLKERGKLKNIMDSRMEGKYCSTVSSQIAQLSLECLKDLPKHRPEMKEVLKTLERLQAASDGTSNSL